MPEPDPAPKFVIRRATVADAEAMASLNADVQSLHAEALLEAVREAAVTLKIELITLDVWSFNASARAFFRRNGFHIYNERLWNRPP